MFNFLRKVIPFLNKPVRAKGTCVPYDSLKAMLEGSKDPWYTSAYWATYRFFKWHKIFHPIQMYKEVKWFVQRGRRGWADCDTWSLDDYLDRMMPGALRYLKAHKHGIPCSMFDESSEKDDTGNPTDNAYAKAEARWDTIMEKMIAAFEANARISDGLYEKELGPWKWSDNRREAENKLIERDQKIFQEGMALFVSHYRSLWD